MRGNRSTGTKPELAVRRNLHALGVRYRVNARPEQDLRRTADILFRKAKLAVFIDGCFWHGCPIHYRAPKQNAAFWAQKIEANRKRDAETDRVLSERGWSVYRRWAHEDPTSIASAVARLLHRDPPDDSGLESSGQ